MKLSLILGLLLIGSVAGSFYYIDYLNDQIAILKGNQIVLETEIERQNESIQNYLAEQKNQQAQLNQLKACRSKKYCRTCTYVSSAATLSHEPIKS